jgi:hypothetical protein
MPKHCKEICDQMIENVLELGGVDSTAKSIEVGMNIK